jgi:hypothetical protein
MEHALALVVAAGLFYALGREHGRRRRRPRARRSADEWSPFDGFYSDR